MFIMMFIVQLALITTARISIEYSAYAAARSAIVWFPANLGDRWFAENRVSDSPLIPLRTYEANGRAYTVYRVPPDGAKFADGERDWYIQEFLVHGRTFTIDSHSESASCRMQFQAR